MLHYYGDQLALELGEAAKKYIFITCTDHNIANVDVAFIDLRDGEKKYAQFQWLAGQWVFTDIIDDH